MNIEVSKADFRRAMDIAGRAINYGMGARMPILHTLRCRANGRFEVTGTDLDVELSASVERVPGKPADFRMTAHREITKSVAAAGGDAVMMTPAGGKVALASGSLSLSALTLPSEDLSIDGDRPFNSAFTATLSPAHIRSLARVVASVSTEETCYYLNGVYMHQIAPGVFRLAAADGHRLTFVDITAPDATGDFPGVIIPRNTVRLLMELAGDAAGDVKLRIGSPAAINSDPSLAPEKPNVTRIAAAFDVTGARVALLSKLIDGTFPDYSRVIPTRNDKPMLFQTDELRRAVKGVSGRSKKAYAVKLSFGEGICTLSSAYTDIGIDASIPVACKHSHPGFEIGFNGGYLLAMIDAAQGDEIVLNFADPAAPVLVKNPTDTEWTGVLMPMRAAQ